MVWAKTANWKKHVIIECKVLGKDDRIYDEYAKEIRLLAEHDGAILSETYPPVPHFAADKKPATAGA